MAAALQGAADAAMFAVAGGEGADALGADASGSAMGLGVLLILLGGVVSGSFTAPLRFIQGWEFENSWLLYTVYGMVRPASRRARCGTLCAHACWLLRRTSHPAAPSCQLTAGSRSRS